jgi:hypothetical protein
MTSVRFLRRFAIAPYFDRIGEVVRIPIPVPFVLCYQTWNPISLLASFVIWYLSQSHGDGLIPPLWATGGRLRAYTSGQ